MLRRKDWRTSSRVTKPLSEADGGNALSPAVGSRSLPLGRRAGRRRVQHALTQRSVHARGHDARRGFSGSFVPWSDSSTCPLWLCRPVSAKLKSEELFFRIGHLGDFKTILIARRRA